MTTFRVPPRRGTELAIGRRRLEARKQATPFVSTLSGPLVCPACVGEIVRDGNLWPCRNCDGIFVENAALEAMVAELHGEPWQLPAVEAPATTEQADPYRGAVTPSRGCPSCGQGMVVATIETIEIDRCAAHGLWFDQGELAAALAKAAEQHE